MVCVRIEQRRRTNQAICLQECRTCLAYRPISRFQALVNTEEIEADFQGSELKTDIQNNNDFDNKIDVKSEDEIEKKIIQIIFIVEQEQDDENNEDDDSNKN